MLSLNHNGLYCDAGNFYIDPIRNVDCAVITHGHADHARWGMGTYVATPETCDIMRVRLGQDINTISLKYHQAYSFNSIQVTLIPAGHILGSAQVVIDDGSQRAIVTGDFKTDHDPTLDDIYYESCDLLVMETTFALPIYHWPHIASVFESIHSFWNQNQSDGYHTVLYAYSLGKAQRLLAGLDSDLGPIAVHGAVSKMNDIYAKYNRLVTLPPKLTKDTLSNWGQPGLIVAPPGVIGSSWLKKLGRYREGYVSGWMTSKGQARRRNMRGFVISDHADWNGLNQLVKRAAPTQVWTMHGNTDIYARYLNEQGISATSLSQLRLERSE
ncbi:MAG: ligase-associated DNA damage response exonuclease [Candidatus Margulisiibacteriota bacterium]